MNGARAATARQSPSRPQRRRWHGRTAGWRIRRSTQRPIDEGSAPPSTSGRARPIRRFTAAKHRPGKPIATNRNPSRTATAASQRRDMREAPATPARQRRERQRDRHQEPHRLAEVGQLIEGLDQPFRDALRDGDRGPVDQDHRRRNDGDHHNCTDGETQRRMPGPHPTSPACGGGKEGVFAFPSDSEKYCAMLARAHCSRACRRQPPSA